MTTTATTTTTTLAKSMCLLKDVGSTPLFVISCDQFRRNCERVLEFARRSGFLFRPHIKTHKTVEGALIQAGFDPSTRSFPNHVSGFVVSTLPELDLLLKRHEGDVSTAAPSPLNNILLGVPITASKLAKLHREIKPNNTALGRIRFLVDHEQHLKVLHESFQIHRVPYKVYVKLDTGYHRAGIPCYNDDDDHTAAVEFVLKVLNCGEAVSLEGLYSHCGHAYNISHQQNASEIKLIVDSDLRRIMRFLDCLKRQLESDKGPEMASLLVQSLVVSVGSTPSLFHHTGSSTGGNGMPANPTELDPRVELHPGNYVFYDRQQLCTGAAGEESAIACRVLATVVSHYPDRRTILLDAGALALSKDTVEPGNITTCSIQGRADLECYKTSQEATLVRAKDGAKFPFDDFPIGSQVLLIPNHSCLAAACFDKYYIVKSFEDRDKAEVVDVWTPAKFF